MSYRITDRVIPGIEEEELRNSELGNSFIVIQYLGSTFSFEVRLFCLLYFGQSVRTSVGFTDTSVQINMSVLIKQSIGFVQQYMAIQRTYTRVLICFIYRQGLPIAKWLEHCAGNLLVMGQNPAHTCGSICSSN